MNRYFKVFDLKGVSVLSLIALYVYICPVNSYIDIFLCLGLCVGIYFLTKNEKLVFNKLNLGITFCLSVFFCLRDVIFDYSFYYFFAGYSAAVRYGILLMVMALSFPCLYKTVSKLGLIFDDFFEHGSLPKYFSFVFAVLLGIRLFACTVFEYVFYIENIKIIDNFALLYLNVAGFIYTVNRVFKKRNGIVYNSLLIMLVVMIVSVFINAAVKDVFYFYDNRRTLMIVMFCVFVLYPFGEWLARSGKSEGIRRFLRIFYYIWGVAMFIVALKIFFNMQFPYMDEVYFTGVVLWINEHYNIVARQIAAFMFIGMYLLSYDRKISLYVVDIGFILINLLLFIMCNSRGAFYTLLMCIGLAVYFLMHDKTGNVYISVAAGVIVACLLYLSRDLPFILYQSIVIKDELLAIENYGSLNGYSQLIGIYRRNSEGFRGMDTDNAGTLNGRLEIWRYCINGIFKDPWAFFIGVTRDATDDFVYVSSGGVRWDYHTHNLLLEVICSSGIFAFIPYVIYLVKSGINSLKAIFEKSSVQFKLMGVFMGFVFVSYFIEMSFITEDAICNYLFFIISGIFAGSTTSKREEAVKTEIVGGNVKKDKRIKYIAVLLITAVMVFGMLKAWSADGYYKNTVSTLQKTETGYYGYESFYLYPGDYSVEINNNAANPFTVEVVELDTNSILVSAACDVENRYVNFTVDSLTKGTGIRIYTEEADVFYEAYYLSAEKVYSDSYVLLCLVLLVLGVSVYFLFYKKNRTFFIIAGIVVFCSLPLVSSDLKTGHDLLFHLDRIFNIGMQYSKGYLIPKINEASLYSMGAVTPMLYPELFLYLPGLLVKSGCSTVLAYKLLCIEANILTAIIAYYAGSKMMNRKVGLLFALLYTINPYRLNEIFIRAALGELLAMAFMPLAFYGVYLLIQDDYKKGFFVSILGISCLVQSQIIGTFIFLMFALVYSVIYVLTHFRKFIYDRDRIITIVSAALFTVCINAWFVIPFIRYQNDQYLILQTVNTLSSHAAPIDLLISDTYVPGISGKGMMVSIGRGSIFSLIACLFIVFTKKLEKQKFIVWCACFGLLGIFLSSSLFPWDLFQYNKMFSGFVTTIQYPWRFQMMSCLFVCAAITVTLVFSEFNNKNVVASILLLMCLFSSLSCIDGYTNINGKEMLNKSDNDIALNNKDYFVYNDRIEYTSDLIRYRIFNAEGNFRYYQDKKEQIIEFSDAQLDTWLELPVYYYRDLYKVTINGTEVDYGCTENNLLVVYMSETAGEIHISFSYTEFIIPYLITVLSIGGLVYICVKKRRDINLF